MKVRGEDEQRRKFELGIGVREWMVKTLSPFPVVARGREIHAQRCTNDADVRERKSPPMVSFFTTCAIEKNPNT